MPDEPTMTQTQVKTKTVSKATVALSLAFLGVAALAAAGLPATRTASTRGLDVEAISITFKSESGSVWKSTGVYRNSGTADTGPFAISIYHQDNDTGELHLLFTKYEQNLKPGEQKTIIETSSPQEWDVDAYLLKVDSNDNLKEKNENNNIYWIGTVVNLNSGSDIDIGVRNLKVAKLNSNQATVTFDIVNYGLIDITESIHVGLERKSSPNFDNYITLLSTYIKGLKAGQQQTITHVMSITPNSQYTNMLRASVDWDKELDDVYWGNNVLTNF